MARSEPAITAPPSLGAAGQETLSASALRDLVMEMGADDCGFVDIDDPCVDVDREYILRCFPNTKTLISLVCRMHVEPVRSPNRTVANLEFHQAGHEVDEVARKVVRYFEDSGIKAINTPMAFPMEMEHFPDRGWIVSHKLIAEGAGMGKRGLHRSLIHHRFGSFVLLGTVLLDARVDTLSKALDFNPCFECKLCVAACPVGAIKPDGYFDFASCYNHNYQQFMGGFVNWIDSVTESRSVKASRQKTSFSDHVVRWQSLAHGPSYNAAYCLSVCPAGSNIVDTYLADKKAHLDQIVRPLQQNTEQVYVVKDSDAEAHVKKRFPHKQVRLVKSGFISTSIRGFLFGITLAFQGGKAKSMRAIYHFTFTGKEPKQATIKIWEGKLSVNEGHVGKANLKVTTDANAWLGFVNKDISLIRLLMTRKLRLQGNPRLLAEFGKCFPS